MKTILIMMLMVLTGCATTSWKDVARALASGAQTYGSAYQGYSAQQRDIYRTYQPAAYVSPEATKIIAQPIIHGNGTYSGYTFIER
jgi:hypothetical protein